MRLKFLLILGALLIQSYSYCQSIPENIKVELERIVNLESNDKNLPAFSIILVDTERIILDFYIGSKTLNDSVHSVDLNTIYRTGSVGKTITDLAVLIAVDQNKLELDKDIRSYLPQFNPLNSYNSPITLRQLIKHQSGLVREPPIGNYFDDKSPSLEETVNSLNNTSLLWEPGSKTKYSNAGLAVVGRILERTYQLEYGVLLDSLIFKPLGMDNSRVGYDSSISKDLARGYMWFPEQKYWLAPLFDLGMKPAGDLYISLNDMASFMIGFLSPDQRLISEKLFDLMWKPSLKSEKWQMDVGLGFSLLGAFAGEYQLVRHGGAVYGYATELAILPKEGLGVYAVVTKDMSGVAKSISTWLLKSVLAYRKGLELPKYETTKKPFNKLASKLKMYSNSENNNEFMKYVGTYGLNYNPLKIYQNNGKLYVLIEWFFLYPLTKIDDETFSFPSWSLYKYEKIKFLFENDKTASEVIIGNGKQGVSFKRLLND